MIKIIFIQQSWKKIQSSNEIQKVIWLKYVFFYIIFLKKLEKINYTLSWLKY